MKRILAFLLAAIMLIGCGSLQRFLGDIDSDVRAGVERTAILYSYDGKIIRRWEGKIDMSSSVRETYLLVNGQRVIIRNGIVVVEEK